MWGKAGMGWGGVGWVESKMSKPIPAPPHNAELKSRPILAHHLCEARKTHIGRSKEGQNCHPHYSLTKHYKNLKRLLEIKYS